MKRIGLMRLKQLILGKQIGIQISLVPIIIKNKDKTKAFDEAE
jgi:hypothetical protein